VSPPPQSLPFDEVRVNEASVSQVLTAKEFLVTPLHRRVGWLLERRLTFLRRGVPVDSREALAALRSVWSGSARS
jgi:hypothetical protein